MDLVRVRVLLAGAQKKERRRPGAGDAAGGSWPDGQPAGNYILYKYRKGMNVYTCKKLAHLQNLFVDTFFLICRQMLFYGQLEFKLSHFIIPRPKKRFILSTSCT